MFGFLLKKWFYDVWDNLPRIALLNLGFYVSLAFPLVLPAALEFSPALAWTAFALGVLWCGLYLCAAARCVHAISDYGIFGFADFRESFRKALPQALVLGGAALAAFLVITVGIPFYGSMEGGPGVFAASALFWALVAGIIVFQYYPSAGVRLDAKALPAVKRIFFFFLDNSPFCALTCLAGLLLIPLSAILGFLAPGPAGILLFHDEALRLRLLKYPWIEENPGRRKIPWDALLIEEREKTGSRSLKNLLFPWKD